MFFSEEERIPAQTTEEASSNKVLPICLIHFSSLAAASRLLCETGFFKSITLYEKLAWQPWSGVGRSQTKRPFPPLGVYRRISESYALARLCPAFKLMKTHAGNYQKTLSFIMLCAPVLRWKEDKLHHLHTRHGDGAKSGNNVSTKGAPPPSPQIQC